jgi:hypothetical protein
MVEVREVELNIKLMMKSTKLEKEKLGTDLPFA